MSDLKKKYNILIENLRALESVVLAYSGGVDSTFLLSALKDAQINAIAVTATSPTMPSDDILTASKMTEKHTFKHKIIKTDECNDENFINNPPDRCFYCKSELFKKLNDIALIEGYKNVIDGSTADDLQDYRPGLKAKELYNVKSPLMDTGLNKDEIRLLSREKGLDTWNKSASPCLSSRFPYGEKITINSLKMVEKAEKILKDMGFMEVRVRKQGDTARIEPKEADLIKFMNKRLRKKIISTLKEIGFLYITLDLEGYQTGKLNRSLQTQS